MEAGFLKYTRLDNKSVECEKRIKTYDEFHNPLMEDERKKQASRCMTCGVPFCGNGQAINNITIGCPLHNYIPEWNKLISNGLYKEAYDRLMITQDFPEFTGRVCPALCEVGCINNINGKPVTIRDNELFIIEEAYKNGWVKPIVPVVERNKSIAVVGSGPSGLACATELRKLGYKVTVYEKSDRFGGLLMYGIPNMKLDKSVIDRRIDMMKKSNIDFINNFDCVLPENKRILDKYDAVCFATGTGLCRDLNVIGRELEGTYFAKDYLTASTKSVLDKINPSITAEGKNVIIIGGGDTGNDCVATAIRQNALSITQFEIMPMPPANRTNEWPLWPNGLKTDYGAQEAIYKFGKDIRVFKTTVKEIKGTNRVEGVITSNVEFVNENGRRVLKDIPNTIKEYKAELIILAMGFVGTSNDLFNAYELDNLRGNIKTINYNAKEKYFACGDAKTGQSLVVKAIADGKRCAKEIDLYLSK